MADTTSAKIYSPLDPFRQEIRLVTIKSGQRSGQIQCHLSCTSLGDSPVYEALSYVWGPPTNLSSILLDGQEFQVTYNLGIALRFLRSEEEDRTMWIDAICINQSDVLERNTQVRIMSCIYQNAQAVVSWLGEPGDETQYAIWLLFDGARNSFSHEWFMSALLGEHNNLRRCFALLAQLLGKEDREYWDRLWITQEIAFAKDGIFQCGDHNAPFWALRKFTTAFEETFRHPEFLSSALQKFGFLVVRDFATLAATFKHHEIVKRTLPGTSLLELLEMNHKKKASNPRDKVYGLLGLSDLSSSRHTGIEIDYRRSVHSVYIGVVQTIVEETSKLNILCSSFPEPTQWKPESISSTSQLKLPSWTPDWSSWSRESFRTNIWQPIKRAAGDTTANVSFQAEEGIITVAGFCIGSVSTCGKSKKIHLLVDINDKHYTEILRCILEWQKLLSNASRNSYVMELFVKTLILGSSTIDSSIDWSSKWLQSWNVRGTMPDNDQTTFDDEQRGFLQLVQTNCEDCIFFLFNKPLSEPSGKRLPAGASFPSMGLSPAGIREGDKVCIFLGCDIPVVIRPEGDHYVFVRAVYVPSQMNGEGMDDLKNGLHKLQSFELH